MQRPRDPLIRLVAAASAVDSMGNGLFYAAGALYLKRALRVSAPALGVLLTAGAAGALAGVLVVGRIVDRTAAKPVLVVLKIGQAGAVGAMLVHPPRLVFVLLAAVLALGDRGGDAARGALIAATGEARRITAAAVVRSAKNGGIAFGAALASVPLAVGGTPALAASLGADGVTFLVCAALYQRLAVPRASRPARDSAAGDRRAFRDRRYLRFVALNTVISLEYPILSLILPLWVARTSAPLWLAPPLLLINTVMCVALQVRASHGCETVSGATRTLRRAAVALAVAALIAASATDAPTVVSVPLMVLFAIGHTIGEMWHAAAGWGLAFGLADLARKGEYQAVHYLGVGLSAVLAPVVLTALCVSAGAAGWLGLAGIFAIAAVATPHVVGPVVSSDQIVARATRSDAAL